MANQPVYGVPLKRLYGETASLTTTAQHKAFMPGYQEVMLYCSSAWRCGIAPALARVFYMTAAGAYTDYTLNATDRSTSTHVPLDAMATGDRLYMGFYDHCPRGVYLDIGTNVNAIAATLDVEYCYDASNGLYYKLTGTVSGAFTVGETVTGGTSAATGTLVYGPAGSTYIVVKSTSGTFLVNETATGGTSTETCSAITVVATESIGTPYFTDVASDSDGTDSPAGTTLGVDGLYSWTLPASVESTVNNASGLHWIRFSPSTALSATVDINEIIPACADTNYGYMEGGVNYNFSISNTRAGAFEFDHTATGTLDITWVRF